MMFLSMSDSGWADALKPPLDTSSRFCTVLTTFSLMLYPGTEPKKGTVLKKRSINIELQDYLKHKVPPINLISIKYI